MWKKEIQHKALLYPLGMVFLMGAGFILQSIGVFSYCSGALIPQALDGLLGIFTSPFLHSGWEHLLGNSIPIVALLFLLFQFYSEVASRVFFSGGLITGGLVWLMPPIIFGEELVCIIGASGIVYMLAFFLFFGGVFRRDARLLTISLLVVLYYGSMIWGILPQEWFSNAEDARQISWQSHAAGALVGSSLAFFYKNKGEKKKKFIWEFPNYYSEKDDRLWQEYIQKHPEDFLEMPHKAEDDIWKHLDELRKNSS